MTKEKDLIENIDKLIKLHEEEKHCLESLKLLAIIKDRFPDEYNNETFFVINEREYRKEYGPLGSERHGRFELKRYNWTNMLPKDISPVERAEIVGSYVNNTIIGVVKEPKIEKWITIKGLKFDTLTKRLYNFSGKKNA